MTNIHALIAKTRELAAKATPRPWQTRFLYRSLASARSCPGLEFGAPPSQDWPDAAFIAHACNSILALVDEVERLRALEKDPATMIFGSAKVNRLCNVIEILRAENEALWRAADAAETYIHSDVDADSGRKLLEALAALPKREGS